MISYQFNDLARLAGAAFPGLSSAPTTLFGDRSAYAAYQSAAKKWHALPAITNRCQAKCA